MEPREEDYVHVRPQEESDNEKNDNLLAWEKGFKFDIPEFHGRQTTVELLEWIVTVEETLEFKRVPLDRCVPLIAMRFRGRAAAWWTRLKTSRARLGRPKISSWDKLKKKMLKTYLPFNYNRVMSQRLYMLRQGEGSVDEYVNEFNSLLTLVDQNDSDQHIVYRFIRGLREKIREPVKLLKPLTIAEAYQQALNVEAQTKDGFWTDVVDGFIGCSTNFTLQICSLVFLVSSLSLLLV